MILGVDFDNTLVCYDSLFYRVALEKEAIPSKCAPTKRAVRDHLRENGLEDLWTELQGYVYGKRILKEYPLL